MNKQIKDQVARTVEALFDIYSGDEVRSAIMVVFSDAATVYREVFTAKMLEGKGYPNEEAEAAWKQYIEFSLEHLISVARYLKETTEVIRAAKDSKAKDSQA